MTCHANYDDKNGKMTDMVQGVWVFVGEPKISLNKPIRIIIDPPV